MGLIDKEKIIAIGLQKKPPQINIGIKSVIIVADDKVRKYRQIQRKFKRTYAVLCGDFLDRFPRKGLVPFKFPQRRVEPVIIPDAELTLSGRTIGPLFETYFFFGRQGHRPDP